MMAYTLHVSHFSIVFVGNPSAFDLHGWWLTFLFKGIMKIAIVGGRDFNDYEKMVDYIFKQVIASHLTFGEIVSGGARGADALAKRFAEEYGHAYKDFPADWEAHGNRAGFLRNEQIIQYSDCCIAFWDGRSKGTKLTIDLCKRYNKPCYICFYGNITAQKSLFE